MAAALPATATHTPSGGGLKASATRSSHPLGSGSTPGEEALFYSEVHGDNGTSSRVAIKVNKENSCGGCKDKQTGISQETMDRIGLAVENSNAYIRDNSLGLGRPDAQNVRVNFTSLRIIYNIGGEDRSLSFTKIEDVATRTLLLDVAKDVESFATTDPSIQSNRPINRSKPLEIHTPTWYNAHRISAAEYAKKDHADLDNSLRANHLPDLAYTALPKIKAAESFINLFDQGLKAKLTEKQTELEALPIDARAQRLAKKREIQQLEELIAKLNPQVLDTKAIFRSVPYANNELEGFTSVAEQMTRANLSREDMSAHLMANIDSISEGLVLKDNPDAAFITAYSQDKGDLLIHNRWQYEDIVDDRGGEKRGPSMEEFVIYNILNLNTAGCTEEAMTSLALPVDDDELRQTVTEVLDGTRTAVKNIYDTDIGRMPAGADLAIQTNILFP